MIKSFILNPYQLLLADSLGALITAALTFFLTQFEHYFRMPHPILKSLACIALLYSVYSFLCYRLKPKKWKFYLKIILLANVLYCLATLTLLFYFHEVITNWDRAYFISEILIMCVVIGVEYNMWSKPVIQNKV